MLKKRGYDTFIAGKYQLVNPDKYIGDSTCVHFRSSWELNFMQRIDTNPSILKWGSEEIDIPYIKPTDGKIHKYFPDFFIQYKDKNGVIHNEIIEIKPASQVTIRKKASLNEQITHAINHSKWEAAIAWCEQRNIKFRVLTEQHLFGEENK